MRLSERAAPLQLIPGRAAQVGITIQVGPTDGRADGGAGLRTDGER